MKRQLHLVLGWGRLLHGAGPLVLLRAGLAHGQEARQGQDVIGVSKLDSCPDLPEAVQSWKTWSPCLAWAERLPGCLSLMFSRDHNTAIS